MTIQIFPMGTPVLALFIWKSTTSYKIHKLRSLLDSDTLPLTARPEPNMLA